jgi:hypothetical protein
MIASFLNIFKIALQHKPRLISDNCSSYIAGELARYIEAKKMGTSINL